MLNHLSVFQQRGGGEVGQSGWVQRVGMLKSPAHL